VLVNKQIKLNKIKDQTFFVSGDLNGKFKINLLGDHQIQNALTAMTTIQELSKLNFKITKKNIYDGVHNTVWKGRLDVINKKPKIILDGAHNQAGMKKIVEFIKKEKNRKILLIGISETHDPNRMLKDICPLFETVVVSKSEFKPYDPKKLFKVAKKYNPNSILFEDLDLAMTFCLKSLNKTDTMLCTGSIYLIGSILSKFN
jgi:dihydrofolate synthase/folylpolyglutamate synthase